VVHTRYVKACKSIYLGPIIRIMHTALGTNSGLLGNLTKALRPYHASLGTYAFLILGWD